MTFDELFDKAYTTARLTEMAKILLPSTLSGETKKAVLRLSPEEFGSILKDAIDQIDRGSVESVDALVRKALKD